MSEISYADMNNQQDRIDDRQKTEIFHALNIGIRSEVRGQRSKGVAELIQFLSGCSLCAFVSLSLFKFVTSQER